MHVENLFQLKLSFVNHLRAASFHIIGTMLMFLFVWFYKFEPNMVFIFTCFWIAYTIPVLYLHAEYTIRNAGEEIEINQNELVVKRNGNELKYKGEDLSKIIVYKSASLDSWMQFIAAESYFYCRIITNGGEEVIITCLMSRKLDQEVQKLSGVPLERKKGPFCTLMWK